MLSQCFDVKARGLATSVYTDQWSPMEIKGSLCNSPNGSEKSELHGKFIENGGANIFDLSLVYSGSHQFCYGNVDGHEFFGVNDKLQLPKCGNGNQNPKDGTLSIMDESLDRSSQSFSGKGIIFIDNTDPATGNNTHTYEECSVRFWENEGDNYYALRSGHTHFSLLSTYNDTVANNYFISGESDGNYFSATGTINPIQQAPTE